MKIDIPFEIGDYVIVIEKITDYYSKDSYNMKIRQFSYNLVEAYMDNRVFGDCASAQKRFEELNSKK